VFSSLQSFSQKKPIVESRDQAEGWYLPVFGQVFESGKVSEGAMVKVYLDNKTLGTFPVSKKGAFKLELDLDRHYTIEFSKEGFITKRISVNTTLDEDVVEYSPYDCFVNLTPESELSSINEDVLDFPAAVVSYNYDLKGFFHSDKYMAHITDMLNESTQQASE